MLKGEMVSERLRRDWSFVPLPSAVLRDSDLSDQEKVTYGYLVDHAGSKRYCWITQKSLAKSRKKGIRTIERHIARLKGMGLIRVQPLRTHAETILIDIGLLYETPKKRYCTLNRLHGSVPEPEPDSEPEPAKNDDPEPPEALIDPPKMAGDPTAKNGGYNKREEEQERKPDTSYLDTIPSGLVFESKAEEVTFMSVSEKSTSPEVRGERSKLRKTHHSSVVLSERPENPGSPKSHHEEFQTVDPDGVAEKKPRKKGGKTSLTKQNINALWVEWKQTLNQKFGTQNPGAVPTGSSYGHLKHLLSYCAYDAHYAAEIMRSLFEEWEQIKKHFPMAFHLHAPTLHLLDVLKEELHNNKQMGKKFGEGLKEKQSGYRRGKPEDVFGVNRMRDTDYSGWKNTWKLEDEKSD